DALEAALHGDVVRGAPLEEEIARLQVDLLEEGVPDEAFGGPADPGEVELEDLVGGDEGGAVLGQLEFVQVSVELAGGADAFDFIVLRVELRCGQFRPPARPRDGAWDST